MSNEEDAYPLPRATGENAAETRRLDEQHEMLKLLLGGIQVAPLPANVSPVLDIGCGTGIWACEFATLHPDAQVLGVDMKLPASDERTPPKNCRFLKANVEEDWTFAEGQKFPFIFSRLLIFSLKDWPALLGRIYEHLLPGGIAEMYEATATIGSDDGSTSETSALIRWMDEVRQHCSSRGVDPDGPAHHTKLLQECGFDVTYDRPLKMYLDPTPGARYDPATGAQVAKQLASDVRFMISNIADQVLSSPAQRELAAAALEDITQNSASRGYHLNQLSRVLVGINANRSASGTDTPSSMVRVAQKPSGTS